jgi:hypothetical protein
MKTIEKEGVQRYGVFNIMRNYLNDDDMNSALIILNDMQFPIDYFIFVRTYK